MSNCQSRLRVFLGDARLMMKIPAVLALRCLWRLVHPARTAQRRLEWDFDTIALAYCSGIVLMGLPLSMFIPLPWFVLGLALYVLVALGWGVRSVVVRR